MTTTHFIDKQTVVEAAWLNDVDRLAYQKTFPDNTVALTALPGMSLDSVNVDYFPAGTGAVLTTVQTKLRESVSVLDFGADSTGETDSSVAFQDACNAAITGQGDLYIPGGNYLIGTTITLGNPSLYTGGIKIHGVSPCSIGKRSNIIQKNLNVPVFTVDSIATHFTGLSFACWSGNDTVGGVAITPVSYTANSITVSGDPWPGTSPVVWNPITPYTATDLTAYPQAIRFSVQGAWVASSATKNGNGTVTFNNVKGTSGTLDTDITGVIGQPLQMIALAYSENPAVLTNPNAGIIFADIRENQFYDHLWFNGVTRCITFDALGSGGGQNNGIGNAGFFSDIVMDQGMCFIYSLGDIFGAQVVNCQFFGILDYAFKTTGDFSSNNISNCKFMYGKHIYCAGDFRGNTITGNSFNELDLYGYCDGSMSLLNMVTDSTFSGNTWGRSQNTALTFGNADGISFTGNNIASHSEVGNVGWLTVNGYLKNSTITANNFAAKYTSGNWVILFGSPTADISKTKFGNDIVFKVAHNSVGWVPITPLNNTWTNIGGGLAPASYFKDENNTVFLRGSITGGTASSSPFTMPVGVRPTFVTRMPIVNTGAFDVGFMSTAGVFSAGAGVGYVELDGFQYSSGT